jgi:hypothetical protein
MLAQSVISAKAGLVHYVEGDVTIDGKTIEMKTSQFPEIKEEQVLETADGRAEVLLTPGVFLRVAENSSFRLVSNRLSDTRVEALTGSMLIEHGEINKDTQVTVLYKDRTISFLKSGLYRLNVGDCTFRVYQGEARVTSGDQSLTAKQAREVQLASVMLVATKFDNKVGDEFYRWASRRASYLALANISAAKSLRDSGMRLTSGMWQWSPWFGMFTYVPYGNYYSPFGYSFWSPGGVMRWYQPRPSYPTYAGGGGGYGGGGGRYDAASGYSIPSRGMSSMGGSSMGGGSMGGGTISNASSGMGAGPSVRGGDAGGGASGGGARGGDAPSGGRGR